MSLLGKDWNDPKTMATLQMAAGLLGGGNFGTAAARGLSGYQDTMKAANAADLAKEERDYLKSERSREKAEREAKQTWRDGLPGVMQQMKPTYGAGDEGPTMTPGNPDALRQYGFAKGSPILDKLMEQQLIPKPTDYRVVGTDLVRLGPDGVSVAHQAPRQERLSVEESLYNLAAGQGYTGDYMRFMRDRAASRAEGTASQDVMPITSPTGTTTMMPRSAVAAAAAGGGAVRPSGSFQGSGYNGGSANAAAVEQREILNRELVKAQREGRTADVAGLQRELGRLPGGAGMPVQSKAQEALAVAQAQDQASGKLADRQLGKSANLASIDAQIGVIDKALDHPGRQTATGLSGVLDPRNYIPGRDAKDFRVVHKQISGAAFLQAFESLKGGGAITEMEGKKATDAMARLDLSQSDEEFEVALQDLREVMDSGRKRLAGPAKQDGGAMPLPPNPTASSLTKGTVYETSRGNATWDGMKFNLVK